MLDRVPALAQHTSSMKCTGIKDSGCENHLVQQRLGLKLDIKNTESIKESLVGSIFTYVIHWKNSFHLLLSGGEEKKEKEKE